MKNYMIIIVSTTILFYGCAHAPATYKTQSTITYQNTYDEVWSSIISIFARKNIPIKTIEKDSGIIVTENMNIPLSEFSSDFVSKYCDCGNPGFPYYYKNFKASYNVFARKIYENRVSVQINTHFTAIKYQGNNLIESIDCVTTGELEKSLFQDLNFRLNVRSYGG